MTYKQLHYKQNRSQQLRGFCHVVQTGSISKAAERMFLSQPSVSLQIQALERELEIILFERNGPHLKLTPEGETLYALARPLVDGMDNLYETFMHHHANANSGSITIAAGLSMTNNIIKEVTKSYMQKYSNVKIKITNMAWKEAVAALRADEIDAAISCLPEQCHDIIYQPLLSYDTVLIMSPDHPLALKNEVTLADVANCELIQPPLHLLSTASIQKVFQKHGLSYEPKLEMDALLLVKRYVEAGLGVAIVSSICLLEEDALVSKDLSRYFAKNEYGILLRKGRFLSRQVKNFIELLYAQLRSVNSKEIVEIA